jgi:nucleoside-diphosphate-sugar epimerase
MRAIIPTIITQCLTQGTIHLGSLHSTRDFNYITNTVSGFMAAATDAVIGETLNLGSGREISIGDLVELIARIMGKTIKVETDADRLRPGKTEVERLVADSTKAKELIGWETEVSLEEGVSRTIEWIGEHGRMFRPGEYAI